MLSGSPGLSGQRELVLFAFGQAVGRIALEREGQSGDNRAVLALGGTVDVGHPDHSGFERRVDTRRGDDVAQRRRVVVDAEHDRHDRFRRYRRRRSTHPRRPRWRHTVRPRDRVLVAGLGNRERDDGSGGGNNAGRGDEREGRERVMDMAEPPLTTLWRSLFGAAWSCGLVSRQKLGGRSPRAGPARRSRCPCRRRR